MLTFMLYVEVLHQLWWKGVATLPWDARDIRLYLLISTTYCT